MDGLETIARGVYLIGGPNISHSEDATVFAVDFGETVYLIDTGAGRSVKTLVRHMEKAGLDPAAVSTVLLTHCHIDHIGGAPFFQSHYGCRLAAHECDAAAIESGDPIMTASSWYGTSFPPTTVDLKIKGSQHDFNVGQETLRCIHTPGHTPGSLSIYLDRDGSRILFGQDIHGPFLPAFKSDIEAWRESMHLLLDLEADILCEGHFGIFRSKERVARYIRSYLDQNAGF